MAAMLEDVSVKWSQRSSFIKEKKLLKDGRGLKTINFESSIGRTILARRERCSRRT